MKRHIFFITVLSIGLFFSCNSENKKSSEEIPQQETLASTLDTATNNDYQIINSTFVHLVSPTPPGYERNFGYHNFDYKQQNISIPSSELDSLYFTPYLVTLKDSIKIRIEPFDPKEKYEAIEDDEYYELVNKLFTDNLRAAKIDLEKVNNKGIYILKAVHPKENPDLEIGEKIISFSRIIYNEEKTKSTFYFESYCSGLCGVGQVVLMEKVNGIWVIKDTITQWVS